MIMLISYRRLKNGFVILFAVLLVSIVLTISLSLFNITFKQLVLSNIARESQIAFFAADGAMNCTRYADSQNDSSNPFGYFDCTTDGSGVRTCSFVSGTSALSCGSMGPSLQSGSFISNNSDPNLAKFTYTLMMTPVNGQTSCANVTLTIKKDATRLRRLLVRGFNNSSASSCPLDSERTVERAQDLTY